jgi:hypothetical protein
VELKQRIQFLIFEGASAGIPFRLHSRSRHFFFPSPQPSSTTTNAAYYYAAVNGFLRNYYHYYYYYSILQLLPRHHYYATLRVRVLVREASILIHYRDQPALLGLAFISPVYSEAKKLLRFQPGGGI